MGGFALGVTVAYPRIEDYVPLARTCALWQFSAEADFKPSVQWQKGERSKWCVCSHGYEGRLTRALRQAQLDLRPHTSGDSGTVCSPFAALPPATLTRVRNSFAKYVTNWCESFIRWDYVCDLKVYGDIKTRSHDEVALLWLWESDQGNCAATQSWTLELHYYASYY